MAHAGTCGVIVGAAVSLAACVSTAPRSTAERTIDSEIAARVEAKLDADPRIYARHIDVRVERGNVHLGGFVWSSDELLFAQADAGGVPGVKGVADEMELMRGGIGGSSR
jgi:osmotically-inducible protein OsmY